MEQARTFVMVRRHDESGVSGVGAVLHGVIFEEGETIIRWRGKFGSVNVFKSYNDFISIHVTSHPSNGTLIIFNDNSQEEY